MRNVSVTRALSATLTTLALAAFLTACTAMTGETAGRNVDDATITTAVKAKLAGDHPVSLTSVGVETVNGTVYLTGNVRDTADKRRASEIAGSVKGVEKVVNNLHTESAADAPRASEPY